MERVNIFNLITLALTFLALLPKMDSQLYRIKAPVTPRPLCASQFALANYACSMLPITPGSPPSPNLPPPSPPSPSSPSPPDDDDEGHKHRHHRRRHGRRHRHRETPQEENCCRWAREVDSQCVCEVLVRLAPFLVRPRHEYSIRIGESCDITYSCGGPI